MAFYIAQSMGEIVGARKVINVTPPTLQEDATSAAIGTSAVPSPYQASYTLALSDFSVTDGGQELPLCKHIANVIICARNSTGSSVAIQWYMQKNSTFVTSGNISTFSTGYYETFNCFFYDVAIGDVLEVGLSCSNINVPYCFRGLKCYDTRIWMYHLPLPFIDYMFNLSTHPAFTLGNPAVASTQGFYFYSSIYLLGNIFNQSSGFTNGRCWPPDTAGPYYLGRANYGDLGQMNTCVPLANTSQYPRYYQQAYVSKFTGRHLFLRR